MHLIHLEDKIYPQPGNKVIRAIETLDLDLDEIEGMFAREQLVGIATQTESYVVFFKSGRQMGVSKSFYESINRAWTKPVKLLA